MPIVIGMATYQSADPGTHPTTNAPHRGRIFDRHGEKPKQNVTMVVGLVLAILVALFVVMWLL